VRQEIAQTVTLEVSGPSAVKLGKPFFLVVTAKNSGADVFQVPSYTCSFFESWHFDGPITWASRSACFKNLPTTIDVPAHGQIEKRLEVKATQKGEHSFSVTLGNNPPISSKNLRIRVEK
jgi:hypothetical protein